MSLCTLLNRIKYKFARKKVTVILVLNTHPHPLPSSSSPQPRLTDFKKDLNAVNAPMIKRPKNEDYLPFFLPDYELFLKSRGKLSRNLVWLPRDPEGELLFGVTNAEVICPLGGGERNLDWGVKVGSQKPIWTKLEVGCRF